MLHVPSNTGASILTQSSQGTTRVGAAQGTAVTPGSGTKGSWTQVIASTDAPTVGIYVNLNSGNTSGALRSIVVDIGIGLAGSEVVLIPDILAGGAGSYSTSGGKAYYFPIRVPIASRISVRGRANNTSAFRVYIALDQRATGPERSLLGSFAQAIGITGHNAVSVTAGSTDKGAWTSLGSTDVAMWDWQLGIQSCAATQNGLVYHVDLAVGDGSKFDILIQDAYWATSTAEQNWNGLVPSRAGRKLPAGSTLYARAQCSGTPEALEIAAYGVGG